MNQAETMIHETNHVLPTALHHLRAVGCDTVTPFVLAVAAWDGDRVDSLATAADRQHFQGLHLAACTLLGETPHAPDLRPLAQRNRMDIKDLADAYRWAGKAQVNHAEALREYVNTRRENPTDRP